jgi:hypothetical protein
VKGDQCTHPTAYLACHCFPALQGPAQPLPGFTDHNASWLKPASQRTGAAGPLTTPNSALASTSARNGGSVPAQSKKRALSLLGNGDDNSDDAELGEEESSGTDGDDGEHDQAGEQLAAARGRGGLEKGRWGSGIGGRIVLEAPRSSCALNLAGMAGMLGSQWNMLPRDVMLCSSVK